MRIFLAKVLVDQNSNDWRVERVLAGTIEDATELVAKTLRQGNFPASRVEVEDVEQTPFIWRSIATGDRA